MNAEFMSEIQPIDDSMKDIFNYVNTEHSKMKAIKLYVMEFTKSNSIDIHKPNVSNVNFSKSIYKMQVIVYIGVTMMIVTKR